MNWREIPRIYSGIFYYMKTNEVWISIKDYPNYQISNLGNVKSLITNKVLLTQIDKYGYNNIIINKKYFFIHRLIAIHFIDNPLNKPQVNHINGIKNDNKIENLEWVTSKENINHSYKKKLHPTCEKHGRSKLSNNDVLLIRELLQNKVNQKFIADNFNISQVSVWKIKKRKTYNNLV